MAKPQTGTVDLFVTVHEVTIGCNYIFSEKLLCRENTQQFHFDLWGRSQGYVPHIYLKKASST